jgi:hypothetical protein
MNDMSAEELYEQVKQLLKDCDSTLQQAFNRLDQDDVSHSHHYNGQRSEALHEYRKTFTLEKAFIDRIRHGLQVWKSIEPNNRSGDSDDSRSLLSFAVDSTAGDSSSGRNTPSGTTSSSSGGYLHNHLLDDSLSIVFEDNGNSSKSSVEQS